MGQLALIFRLKVNGKTVSHPDENALRSPLESAMDVTSCGKVPEPNSRSSVKKGIGSVHRTEPIEIR